LPDEIEARLTSFHLAEWVTAYKMEKEANDEAMRKAKMKRGR
jgi:hypothetical protein